MVGAPRDLRAWVVGPTGVRAGWRLLGYIALVALLFWLKEQTLRPLLDRSDEVTSYVVNKAAKLAAILLAGSLMARLEHRSLATYGLPWRRTLRGGFWRGAAAGLAAITVLLGILRVVGVFRFGPIALQGLGTWEYAAAFALVFLLIGLQEEFHYRGYGLYTLTTGLGFWPAALLSMLYFTSGHLGNVGESPVGLLNVGVGGLLFCLLLRRTGDLWMPIGMHAAWDWGQSFLYGVPDSGYLLPMHVFQSSFAGPAWLTGGAVGPEGSVLCTVLLVALGFGFSRWLPQVCYPGGVCP
ncbi:MAG TPA: CPBP family intramembrane glutamic endopeptidase [Gemmatimonadales bacterium]|nr:CPBP family intramembrane glutamic endopeptidase [Gemmatimonadales bacterium]